MPARFSMETDERADAVHVALHGELDMARADEVTAELDRVDRLDPPRPVLLDLRGLTFLDSSGLRVIVMAGTRSQDGDRAVCVVRGSEQIQHVFEITGMDRELTMVDHPDERPNGGS